MILTITREGKKYINSVSSLQRRILIALQSGRKNLLDLVTLLQRTYDEYKFMKVAIVMEAIAHLMKLKCVDYSGDY